MEIIIDNKKIIVESAKSCEYCKHFEQIPKKLSLGDLEQDYFRFCNCSGLHEPIDDTWQLEHEICFCKKGE